MDAEFEINFSDVLLVTTINYVFQSIERPWPDVLPN